ncbi:MAG TPA: hypothetical protein VIA19_11115 [Burkholderiales bacterium]|jgi:hypothetical protein
MKLNDFELARSAAARPLPAHWSETGGRAALAALRNRLEKAWIGLYAPPPRNLPPMV